MSTAAQTRLLGLVLAGGRSTRMQRDKASLRYHGTTQLEHACRLLAPHVDQVYISVRADQQDDPSRGAWPQIVDRPGIQGPIAGIASAQAAHPGAAFWVLACDLPYLDEATLQTLQQSRDCGQLATAFRSSHDGLPEPLCAIYEPASAAAIANYIATGGQCPRKFLGRHATRLLDAPNARALDNINTPQEYAEAMKDLHHKPAAHKTVHLQYFALLREQAGRSHERFQTRAHTAAELFAEVRQHHPFTLEMNQLRVAINEEFSDWTQEIRDGDEIVFIPPVAGG